MIIGLVGFIGSGKGTVGDILVQEHGYVADSFAAPLKDAVAAMFGWDRTLLEGATKESREWREELDTFWSNAFGRPFTPREALQLMGTEAGRNVFHKDLWVASLFKRAQGRNVVITDCRFKNEIEGIHKEGGLVIRVKRGADPFWYREAYQANTKQSGEALEAMRVLQIHQSEWDWIGSPCDAIIDNDGTLADLQDAVRKVAFNIACDLTIP